jgi:MoaA/NifB/PqqE/SkfB family radical SAM enzyme
MERSVLRKEKQPSLHSSPHWINHLPVLVVMPHSRCDCRCLMCDIWKDLKAREICEEQLQQHMTSLKELCVSWVVFSGGEPLLHSNLFALTGLLRTAGIRVTLLSTGQRLSDFSAQVARHTDDSILSLDGPESVHDTIRRVTGAFRKLVHGMEEVHRHRPDYPFSCRTTVQRANFRYLRQTLGTARLAGFNSISYLAADVTSTAFNHPEGWKEREREKVAVPKEDLLDLENEIERLIQEHASEIESGFIRENPEKLRRLVRHFKAQCGVVDPIAPRCNAPWVSAVVEADGTVRPCFFHRALGNIGNQPLVEIVNSREALNFRNTLDVATNATCQRCVCSLYLNPTT